MIVNEQWKPVPGYEGIYEISDMGRLRSLERDVVKSDVVQHRRLRMKKQWPNDDGYMCVKLSRDGHNDNVGVHRLVAAAFIPNPQRLPEVNHKDGDRVNNRVDNLEWVTHAGNVADAIARGTHISLRDLRGENNPNYGNRKLSSYYAEHPDAATAKQSRPGAQNGRCRPVRLILPSGESRDFAYITECCVWLDQLGLCKAKPASVAVCISRSATTGEPYRGMKFEFIE